MTEPFLAWHFTAATLCDGRPLPADGVMLRRRGASGLFACYQVIDALRHATGSTVCRVRVSGKIKRHERILYAAERTIIWRLDVSEILATFARHCALDVAHLWEMPAVVREYLETGDEKLRDAAHIAARDATNTANAAHIAARNTANTVSSAAYPALLVSRRMLKSSVVVAIDVAHATNRAAWPDTVKWDANWDDAWAAQNTRLTAMVEDAYQEQTP